MKMDIKAWSKTPDGIAMVEHQRVFCIGTQLWQGFRGVAIRAFESQMSTIELQEVAKERDVDDTMQAVWFRRKQRLESRFMRKAKEYDDREAVLRRQRSVIRSEIREDKADQIPVSPASLRAITRIDKRMDRLNLLHEEEELRIAELHEKGGPDPDLALLTDERELTIEQHERTDADDPILVKPDAAVCDWPGCGKACPPGKVPGTWLRSHKMGAHIGPQKRAEKKAALEKAAASEEATQRASA